MSIDSKAPRLSVIGSEIGSEAVKTGEGWQAAKWQSAISKVVLEVEPKVGGGGGGANKFAQVVLAAARQESAKQLLQVRPLTSPLCTK
eukprot:1184902-Prorocentrum_minimum.AAC.3